MSSGIGAQFARRKRKRAAGVDSISAGGAPQEVADAMHIDGDTSQAEPALTASQRKKVARERRERLETLQWHRVDIPQNAFLKVCRIVYSSQSGESPDCSSPLYDSLYSGRS